MRTAVRTFTALALAAPLVASSLPASASSSFLYREKGALAEAYFEGSGTPGGLPGNYTTGMLTVHGSDLAEGFVDTYTCDEGQTPWDDESSCVEAGFFFVWGEGVTVTAGKGKNAASTFSGTVDLYDANTENGDLAASAVPFEVTLTPTGATSKTTNTYTFRDPESGVSYRSRETQVMRESTAQGDLDGVPAVGGTVGTYSVRFSERVA